MGIQTNVTLTCDLCKLAQEEFASLDEAEGSWIKLIRHENEHWLCPPCVERVLVVKNAYCR